ncbi:DUF899 domain-containing protein [Amycolatopsis sp. cg5]|uniref:DUF899 domain-containing protein n=1 Tax=Amycolatopsis sp. cg5 TaxID=3238802 RepID=UPI003524CF81
MNLPEVVSRDEWLDARRKFLEEEKAFTRARDELNANRRRLPMVRIEKDYVFQGAEGAASLPELFDGKRQLIVYHFMFHPDWDAGCRGCSKVTDHIGHLAHLHARDTNLVLVSRAPYAKLAAFKQRMGWAVPWFSSHDSDFNYDFHVTLDESVKPVEYNYKRSPEISGDRSGLSVFLRDGSEIFHTYSTYARGTDLLTSTSNYLDLTPLGRQEHWEQPAGRSYSGPGEWWRLHDEY